MENAASNHNQCPHNNCFFSSKILHGLMQHTGQNTTDMITGQLSIRSRIPNANAGTKVQQAESAANIRDEHFPATVFQK